MSGYVIGKQLNNGYPGTVSRLADAIVNNRAVRSTDTNNVNFGDPVVLNTDNTYSQFTATNATLGSALTSGTAYTSLTVSALPQAMLAGASVLLVSGSNTQTVTLSADAAAGATTLTVVSFTANYAYPTTTTVIVYNDATQFAGVAVREVKQSTQYFSAQGDYEAGQPCDVLERGSITVTCNEGTPTSGGDVYIVTYAGSGAVSAVSTFIAQATPAGTGSQAVKIPNAQWKTNNIDSNKVAELTLVTRNKA